ncbi:Tyrosine-protein phosphatase non-receptor type 4 [Hypsibius exemplaris]|uniref:protein-tyrosine-phosphatase n=1 Tax=Hypsibius exemplaris TaxID=2072580 RepID=A0A1W0WMP9_HYPEX|nr:Tyrosine-protein phosphatase non-receptor type 4 [Hypsibius exemplaris]
MSAFFRNKFGVSGTYRVKEVESVWREKPTMKATTPATVQLLDGESHTFHIDKHAKGQALLDLIGDHVDLMERDYFGLQFADPDYEASSEVLRWLEPHKSIKKQLKSGAPYILYFRVKFYVSDPCLLHDEYTRYNYFLQLKRDIQEGNLAVPASVAPLLASYVVQSELGDFDPDEHKPGYLSQFKFVPDQNPDFDIKVHELHKRQCGQTPADAEYNFLDQCKRLSTYGIILYDAKDANGVDIQLGVTYSGLVVFQNALRLSVFLWTKILKISFKQRQFFIQIHDETKEYDILWGFYMLNVRTCKALWKSCVEHHSFFRMNSTRPLVPKKFSLFSLGSRLSGRTEYKTLEDGARRFRVDKSSNNIIRSPSKRHRRTIGGTASSRDHTLEEKPTKNQPHQTHQSSHSVNQPITLQHGNQSINQLNQDTSPKHGNQSINQANQATSPKHGNQSINQPNQATSPKHFAGAPILHNRTSNNFASNNNNNVTILHVGHALTTGSPVQNGSNTNGGGIIVGKLQNGDANLNHHSHRNGGVVAATVPLTAKLFNHSSSRRASPARDNGKGDDDGGFREAGAFNRTSSASAKFTANHIRLDSASATDTSSTSPPAVNGISYRAMPTGDSHNHHHHLSSTSSPLHLVPTLVSKTIHLPQQQQQQQRKDLIIPSILNGGGAGGAGGVGGETNGAGNLSGLVCIRIRPDADGKFGFHVRGGVDLDLPVIVTRVAPNTPADTATPRLNEGDQVVMINGQDTGRLTHDEAVILIKSSRETRSGELVLYVRPNVCNEYNGGDADEPEFQYIPDTPKATNGHGSSVLQESLLLLSDSLANSTALMQFEQLYRKNPKMTMKDAEIPGNNPRNRYKDVLPYDTTRVLLHGIPGNDYVNANFVNMEIPSSGIVNRYIAAQGPLPHTTADFWQMVWEQQSTLVVMLTSLMEQGRIKCHKYWPDLYETSDYGMLQVTCVKEQDSVQNCFAFRELTLIHMETNEERHITHMQYIAWPDHGVPDDATDFLDFVIRVRQTRVGMGEPSVIHCSAGIGRTGVLILMETAMCLIEANEPVYPLDIVRAMRDQRAMLIQTTSQYKFVCEAILRVFNEGLVKPLDDYRP